MTNKSIKIDKEQFEKVFKNFKWIYINSCYPLKRELDAMENMNSIYDFFRGIDNQVKK